MIRNARVLATMLFVSAGCQSINGAKLQDEGLAPSLSQLAQDAAATRSLRIFNDNGNIRILQLTFGQGEIAKGQVAFVLSKLKNFNTAEQRIDLEALKSTVLNEELFSNLQQIVDGILMPQSGPLTSAVSSPDLVAPAQQALASLQTILQRLADGETLTHAEATAPVDEYIEVARRDLYAVNPKARDLRILRLGHHAYAPATFPKSNASILTDTVYAANALKQIFADRPVYTPALDENVLSALSLKEFVFYARSRADDGRANAAVQALRLAYGDIKSIAARSAVKGRADANLIETLIDSKTQQVKYNQYVLNFEHMNSAAVLAFRSSQAPTDSVGAVAAKRGWTFKFGQKLTWREWLSWRFNSRIPRDAQMSAAQYLTVVKFAAAVNDLDDPRTKPLLNFLSSRLGRSLDPTSNTATQSPMDVKDPSTDVADEPILDHIDIDGTEIADTVHLPDEPASNGTNDAAAAANENQSAAGDSPDASADTTPSDPNSGNADSGRPGDARR